MKNCFQVKQSSINRDLVVLFSLAALWRFRRRQHACVLVVQLKKERHSFGIGLCSGRFETCPCVSGIHGLVQSLMRTPEIGGHGDRVVQVGE